MSKLVIQQTLRIGLLAVACCVSQGLIHSITFAAEPTVEGVTEAPSFRRDVMPILFRAGCNAGTCHGSARGKDGFMLSLFGYDAKGDY